MGSLPTHMGIADLDRRSAPAQATPIIDSPAGLPGPELLQPPSSDKLSP